MHYANPNFSFFFSAIFILSIFYLWAMRRRRMFMERFAERNLISQIAPSFSIRWRILKILILIMACIFGLMAFMRPQWGFEWEEVKRTGLDILIAMDVSKSMLAKDVKPNRLERSKFAVKDLMKKLNGDRIGLVAFAGTAFLQCPLTIDYNGFLLALDDLNVNTIPMGGTSISYAIKEALDTFSAKGRSAMNGLALGLGGKGPEKKYRVLIVITDGEDLQGDALKVAKEAASAGIRIYCVGIGTTEGDLIQITNERGDRIYLTDREGNVVKTRLNEDLLKNIAISTGGSYVRATQAEFGLTLLYDKSISRLEKRDIEAKMKKQYQERFQIFLSIAIALLIIEPFIAEKKRLHT